jgi:hypothetical protein
LAYGPLSRLELFCDISHRGVLVAESALS